MSNINTCSTQAANQGCKQYDYRADPNHYISRVVFKIRENVDDFLATISQVYQKEQIRNPVTGQITLGPEKQIRDSVSNEFGLGSDNFEGTEISVNFDGRESIGFTGIGTTVYLSNIFRDLPTEENKLDPIALSSINFFDSFGTALSYGSSTTNGPTLEILYPGILDTTRRVNVGAFNCPNINGKSGIISRLKGTWLDNASYLDLENRITFITTVNLEASDCTELLTPDSVNPPDDPDRVVDNDPNNPPFLDDPSNKNRFRVDSDGSVVENNLAIEIVIAVLLLLFLIFFLF